MNTGLKDVRSILRRLLATTINSSLPSNAEQLMNQTVLAMESGEIHSPSRFPAQGQHDRVRFRSEAKYKTVESIDAPMNPDLRLVLMWVYFNQIMNVIALDALVQTKGDESRVIDFLKCRWGNIFFPIPTLGKDSSFEQDLEFNQNRFNGKIKRLGNKTFQDTLISVNKIIEYYSCRYPAIYTQAKIVSKMINQLLSPQIGGTSLSAYLGIENGNYNPNGLNRGIITDYKTDSALQELIEIQSKATQLQAEALCGIRDEQDLQVFFGIV